MKSDLVIPSASQPSAPPPPSKTTTTDDRSTTFRPVEGGTQLQSGEKLLVEAYAALWLILFGLILLSWKRQQKLDERVASLASSIDRARREGVRGGET